MSISRRRFLETVGLGAGAVALSVPGLGPRSTRRLVFAHVAGGWDTLLSLDPRDPWAFADADAERTGIELGWRRLAPGLLRALIRPAGSEIVLGPMAAALARHCDQACVVNGIAVGTDDHEAAARAFVPVADGAVRLAGIDDLAGDAEPLEASAARRYHVRHARAGEAQAALAARVLRDDLAPCLSIQLATGLDTHAEEWATVQPRRQIEAFEAAATLMDDLRREGSLDRTTIVVFSEFGRSARLNARGGRDHGSHASAVLIGAGVPHGRVIGGTGDGLRPLPVDPRSGRPVREGGVPLTPERLWASVLAGAGVRCSALAAEPMSCLMG
jgi:uncharacterized protein DUF1501